MVQLSELESVTLEYKREVDERSIRKTTVGFANAQGGTLKIGVDDDLTVVGIDREEVDKITHIVRDGSVPPLNPQVDIERYGDKVVIAVTIKDHHNVPYRTISGMYYVRVGATTRMASLSELIDLIIKGPYSGTITMRMRLLELIAKIHAGMQHDEKHALTSLSELEWLLGLSMDMGTKSRVVVMLRSLIRDCKNERIFREILDFLVNMSHRLLHIPRQDIPEQIDSFSDNGSGFTSQDIFDQIISAMGNIFFMLTIDRKIIMFSRISINRIYRLGLVCIGADDTERLDKIVNILSNNKDQQLDQNCKQAIQQLRNCAQSTEAGSELLAWFKPLPAGPH